MSHLKSTTKGLVEKETGRKIMSPLDSPETIPATKALIKPFELHDAVTGDKIKLTTSPQYSVLSINDRSYYFFRETGKLDGTSVDLTLSEAE